MHELLHAGAGLSREALGPWGPPPPGRSQAASRPAETASEPTRPRARRRPNRRARRPRPGYITQRWTHRGDWAQHRDRRLRHFLDPAWISAAHPLITMVNYPETIALARLLAA